MADSLTKLDPLGATDYTAGANKVDTVTGVKNTTTGAITPIETTTVNPPKAVDLAPVTGMVGYRAPMVKAPVGDKMALVKTAPITPIGGASEKPKEIKVSTADPHFEQTAGAILLQRQQEKAVTDQLMQNQAARSQFMQQLQDSGQRGSTLGTLAMLKDRELNSALDTVEWNFTNKYMDYLQTKTDAVEASAKLQFKADYDNLLASGFVEEANQLMSAMASQFPDDPYLQTAATPEYQKAVQESVADPAIQQRQASTLANAQTWLQSQGDIFDENLLTKNAPQLLGMLRKGYTQTNLDLGAASMDEAEMKDYLSKYYPGYENLSLDEIPKSIKEEAAMMQDFQGKVGLAKDQQTKAIIDSKVANIGKLDNNTAGTLKATLEGLALADGNVKLAGVTIPATYFTDMDSGASSIFVADWDGDSDFGSRLPEYNAMDGVWARAVAANYGDFQMNGDDTDLRENFAQSFYEASTDVGITPEDFQKGLTNGQMKLIWDTMARKNTFTPADTGNGSYSGMAQAFESGDMNAIATSMHGIDYSDPRDAGKVDKLIAALTAENGGVPLPVYREPSSTTEWVQEPGIKWLTLPNGQGGSALVSVEVGKPSYNKDSGMWTVPITFDDPTGVSFPNIDPDQSIEITEKQANAMGYKSGSSKKSQSLEQDWTHQKYDKYLGGDYNPVIYTKHKAGDLITKGKNVITSLWD